MGNFVAAASRLDRKSPKNAERGRKATYNSAAEWPSWTDESRWSVVGDEAFYQVVKFFDATDREQVRFCWLVMLPNGDTPAEFDNEAEAIRHAAKLRRKAIAAKLAKVAAAPEHAAVAECRADDFPHTADFADDETPSLDPDDESDAQVEALILEGVWDALTPEPIGYRPTWLDEACDALPPLDDISEAELAEFGVRNGLAACPADLW